MTLKLLIASIAIPGKIVQPNSTNLHVTSTTKHLHASIGMQINLYICSQITPTIKIFTSQGYLLAELRLFQARLMWYNFPNKIPFDYFVAKN